jgi:hypothetical protein
MRSFYYRPGKNAFLALLLGGLGLFFGKVWFASGGFIPMVSTCLLLVGAAKLGFDAMSREPVIKFDEQNLWVRKAFGGLQQIPWRDVHHVGLKVLTIRYYGIIPVGRTEQIVITCNGGTFGAKRLRLSAGTIDLPPAGAAELVHILQKAHEAAVGLSGVAMAGAPSHGWGVKSSKPAEAEPQEVFDADAAIARYLAQKEAGAKAEAAAPAPASPLHVPQRPVFGRRVS